MHSALAHPITSFTGGHLHSQTVVGRVCQVAVTSTGSPARCAAHSALRPCGSTQLEATPQQLIRQPPPAAAAAARPQTCGRHSSRSAARMQARVFDKIRDLLSSGSNSSGPSSSEDDEVEEGTDLVPIDTEGRTGLGGATDDAYGPLAVLLVGFMQHEVDAFRALMNDMDADIVKLIPCQRSMLPGSLLEAFQTECPVYEQPPLGQRRALFMSGMYGSEVTEVIAAYRDAGLPPCVFAALVPNNASRSVEELLDAVWRDHAAMMAKMQQQNLEDSY